MKHCNTCDTTKELSEFHKHSKSPDGYKNTCKICRNALNKEYRKRNKEKVKAYHKEHYEKNKEEHLKRCVEWQQRNKIKVKQYQQRYRKKHSGRVTAKNRKRELAKLERTPLWADNDKINGTYMLAQYLMETYGCAIHVDHIVPLRGELVSGLHVENNLQLLFAEDNLRKGNTFKE